MCGPLGGLQNTFSEKLFPNPVVEHGNINVTGSCYSNISASPFRKLIPKIKGSSLGPTILRCCSAGTDRLKFDGDSFPSLDANRLGSHHNGADNFLPSQEPLKATVGKIRKLTGS